LARSKIRVVRGSIVDQDVECIVNAANEALTGGGGVDGVIHNACGDELRLGTPLLEALKRLLLARVASC